MHSDLIHILLVLNKQMSTQLVQPCLGILFQVWTGPLGFQEVEASTISRQSAHDGGKVVGCTHLPSLSPGDMPGTHFCYVTGRNMSTKYPVTQTGIEPATLQLVAQPTAPQRFPYNRIVFISPATCFDAMAPSTGY
jgi:hypothetical protein